MTKEAYCDAHACLDVVRKVAYTRKVDKLILHRGERATVALMKKVMISLTYVDEREQLLLR